MPSKAVTVFPNVKAISKKDLLDFMQQYINPQLKAIVDLRTGSDFCVGMKVLFPETISLQAIKFGPDLSNISIYNNFKHLQSAFAKVGVEKDVPMDSIMQGNFQANFYFGQWFMGFFFANYAGQVYNPVELRNFKKVRSSTIVSGGCSLVPSSTGKLPFVINYKHPLRNRLHSAPVVSVSAQTDESYLMNEAKVSDQEHYVDELRVETRDLQEVIKYLQNENRKLMSAIDCTNRSTQLFFGKLEKIEKLCEKERQHSLRTAVESALYSEINKNVSDTETEGLNGRYSEGSLEGQPSPHLSNGIIPKSQPIDICQPLNGHHCDLSDSDKENDDDYLDDQVVGAFASDLSYNLNKPPSGRMDDIPFISLLQNANKTNLQSCSPSGVSHSSAADDPVNSPENDPPITDHLLHQYASDAASDEDDDDDDDNDENCNQDGFVLIDSIPPFAGEDTSSELWRCYQETQGVPTLTICKEEFTLAETLQDVTNQLQAFESNSKDFDDFVNELAEKE